jgi:hypothetical protein
LSSRRAWAFLAGATALVAAGCGGDDQLSQAEFREQANAVCAKYEEQIDELAVPSSVEQIPAYVEKAAPLVEQELDELKSLEPPDEDRETYDQMIAEEEKTLTAGRELSEAAQEKDDVALERALDAGNVASEKADQHAEALGLNDCVDRDE